MKAIVRDRAEAFEHAEHALKKVQRKLEGAQKKVILVQESKAEKLKEQQQIQGGVNATIAKLDDVKEQLRRREEVLHNKTAPKSQIVSWIIYSC